MHAALPWTCAQRSLSPSAAARVWLVTRDGSKVVDAGPNLYGQFFVIYAAVQFSKVS
jgi:mannose/cellobiose epimerase-like protein (N-acyl-D-glucosamine 2-epimerase family)